MKRWNEEEIELIWKMSAAEWSYSEISERLREKCGIDRTPDAIRCKLSELKRAATSPWDLTPGIEVSMNVPEQLRDEAGIKKIAEQVQTFVEKATKPKPPFKVEAIPGVSTVTGISPNAYRIKEEPEPAPEKPTDRERDIIALHEKAVLKEIELSRPRPGQRIRAMKDLIIRPRKSCKKQKKVLVYGDTHHAWHDQDAIEIMFQVAKRFDPDVIIDNGDGVDCYAISSFTKTVPDPPKVKEEFAAKREQLARLREICPNAEFHYNEGNHEFRLKRYVANSALEIRELIKNAEEELDLKELDIRYNESVDGESDIDLGKILVGHWDKASKHSGYTAKALVTELGMSLVQGHTHRLGAYHVTQAKRQLVGYEGGCLCDLNPTYKKRPNWQQGFCLIHFVGDYFQVQVIPIVRTNGKAFAIFGSELFERKVS